MRTLLSLALISLCFSLFAQETITYPYNPDGDVDGAIASPDLLDLLGVYGGEFSPSEIQIDGINLLQVIQDLQNQIGALQGEMLDVNYVESTFSAMQQEIDYQQQDIEALQTENATLTQQVLDLQNAGFLTADWAEIDNVDIDSGNIDGTIIGSNTATEATFTNLTSTGGIINLGIDDTNNEIKIGTNDSGGAASVARTINIGNDKATVNIVYDPAASLSLNGTVLTSTAADLNTINNSATTGNLVVGTGIGDGTLKSNGDHNLILKTGNSTTGTIEMVDGANGDIMIQPNGTGKLDVTGILDCEQLNINGTQVLTNQQPAITDLFFGATLPDVILKVNDILALLRTHGLIAS